MNLLQVSALLLAGLVGGGLNAVAGGGSLITYPTLMAVGVPPGPTLRMTEPRVLFRVDPEMYPSARDYYTPWDISPDGRRFLMARRVRAIDQPEAPLLMTLNWFEELRHQSGAR